MEKEYNLAIRGNVPNARGTIHPRPKGAGFSLPLDPTDYKMRIRKETSNGTKRPIRETVLLRKEHDGITRIE